MTVSRAGLKIEGASAAFNFDFRGKKVLDIGSSTGGFTEFALESGATLVVAVEKGARQMKAPLRFDSRVELHENTDIFDVASEDHAASEKVLITTPDVILADVSFISLKPVLAYAKEHIAGAKTDFLVMLKPQFEALDSQLNRGVVKNEKIRREIIKEFESWLRHNGFLVKQKRDNVLAGKKGNIERFYWLNMV
ncbi:TlyA family rRNA (cytidine-2'-O)-methyltransferase [Candidatus Saccharibacteria bacterium]|nr:TlyA family rRNA (cytidine-2'-O)-methyltransferase [Candidatus Saccharibacteria bacterium]